MNEDRTQVTYRAGVCTLEIFNTTMDDAGKYSCSATNKLGEDETICVLTVQGRAGEQQPSMGMSTPARPRRVYDSLKTSDVERSRSAADVPRRSAAAAARQTPPPTQAARPKDDLATVAKEEATAGPSFSSPLVRRDSRRRTDYRVCLSSTSLLTLCAHRLGGGGRKS